MPSPFGGIAVLATCVALAIVLFVVVIVLWHKRSG